MIGRILVSLTASALAGFLLLVLIGLWDGYNRKPKRWDSAEFMSAI